MRLLVINSGDELLAQWALDGERSAAVVECVLDGLAGLARHAGGREPTDAEHRAHHTAGVCGGAFTGALNNRVGRFREDLYCRLNVVPMHVPPWRERLDDIALLAGDFPLPQATSARRSVTEPRAVREPVRKLPRHDMLGLKRTTLAAKPRMLDAVAV